MTILRLILEFETSMSALHIRSVLTTDKSRLAKLEAFKFSSTSMPVIRTRFLQAGLFCATAPPTEPITPPVKAIFGFVEAIVDVTGMNNKATVEIVNIIDLLISFSFSEFDKYIAKLLA